MPLLLIVDDEPNLLYSMAKALRADSLEIVTAQTGEEGVSLAGARRPDAMILDVRLPDMSGLDAFSAVRRLDSRLPVIFVTAYSTAESAIEAMKRGAFEYLLKPVELDRLRDVVSRALEISRMSRVPAMFAEDEPSPTADLIVGRSPAMQEVYKAIGRAAPQDVTVLILGESGTGKEMIARAIYQHSRRCDGPFLAINCAAIPEPLLESELFGHERGAFTGADRQRVGKFEQVGGGTLFLDEIGDMTPATQSKVLRLLQDGSFQRVGGNDTVRCDVRIIAATNRDLSSLVEGGEFRRDLYYRLRVFAIELPPLRQRRDDIPLLVEHFVKVFGREHETRIRAVSPGAMDRLRQHDWPGNVRELQSAVRYALLTAAGETITLESLPELGGGGAATSSRPPVEQQLPDVARLARELLSTDVDDIYRRIHSEVDRILLEQVLNYVHGNQAQAAQLLGISRGTLRSRINDLKLSLETRVQSEPE